MKQKSAYMRLAAGIAVGMATSMAMGQAAPVVSFDVPIQLDTGIVTAPLVGQDATDEIVVFVDEIRVPNASWLRLKFDEVDLAPGAYLRITSMLDGAQHILSASALREWNNTSAYMNGDTVHVEIIANPGSGASRLVMSELTAGEPVGVETICGPTDDRVRSNDARQGRLMPVGCTAWLIENGNFGNRFLTAGHCISNGTTNAVVQFNVPLSTSSGGTVNPPPQDQYPVPSGNINSNGGVGPGDDWAHFFTAANSNTGLTPREAMGGGAYRLRNTAPAANNQSTQIVGYGTTSPRNNLSQVQKTHKGPLVLNSGNLIRYETDTTGGNSGSPVVDSADAGLAIGIHTHAGCTSTGGSNQGTDISHPGVQGALSSPSGTGIPMDGGAVTTIFDSNNGGSAGGAVYFDIEVGDSNIRVNGLQTNVDATFGGSFDMDVYVVEGGSSGNQTNMGLWTQVDTGTGTPGPEDTATQIFLNSGFVLDANTTYGIALVMDSTIGHDYTNGNGSNETFSNGDITLSLGSATNVPFSGTPFEPRVWNGTIQYELVQGDAGTGPFAYSIDSNGGDVLHRINLMTGEATPLGTAMNFGDAEGMTSGPNGRLYAIGGSVEELWNVTSYPGELIGNTGTREGTDAGLDFFRGTLYNLNSQSGSSFLYRVNPSTGASALIGTSSTFGDGLAIHQRTGAAYTADFIFTDSLYRVNLSTGALTLVGPLNIGNVSLQCGMAFLGDTLYAITSDGRIFTIDTTSGAATEVADTGVAGWEGLAITSDACDGGDIGNFGSTFSSGSLTRGYWFEAPRDFNICGLRVPDESGAGVQNVEVVRVNGSVPAFPSTTNDFESLFRRVGVAGNSIMPAAIPVRQGDIIAVIGATGTSTMNSSYAAPSGPFMIEIGGAMAEVTRAGMQFNLNSTPLQDLWTEPSGPVGRVEMYYTLPSDVSLDMDTAATGQNLDTTPLNTALGVISPVSGVEITNFTDLEFNRAGAGGNNIDQLTDAGAEISFGFDVNSLTFAYGGNIGEIRVQALDAGGAVVDEFFQGDTNAGQPAGPQTLAGEGIRALRWRDVSGAFAALDNIKITGIENVSCYPDCTGEGTLDIFDFLCFQDAFVSMDPYADCTGEGTFDIFDFLCFQDAFVTGCP